mgnify:CR=1 FL=1
MALEFLISDCHEWVTEDDIEMPITREEAEFIYESLGKLLGKNA